MQELGVLDYTTFVAVPSLIGAGISRITDDSSYYHDQPWEYMADVYGGVEYECEWFSKPLAKLYWRYVKKMSSITKY